ncbi:hypothetical protein FNV43_RR10859 [Rhamnella rubrinervis]|uniref:RING-type E3 ubiquitin transferase n=1 Tax=Rhamnella rubrinervis TaxID=2594499 RepID=A0A8K0H4W3_9ROSA|nr:hypothetical protein FNV43_RR10859 [Rhamnella rubrinervis]
MRPDSCFAWRGRNNGNEETPKAMKSASKDKNSIAFDNNYKPFFAVFAYICLVLIPTPTHKNPNLVWKFTQYLISSAISLLMSLIPSGVTNNGAGTRTYQTYWCYQCHRTVRLDPTTNPSEIVCPRCFGNFLCEMDVERSTRIIDYTDFDPSPGARLLEALTLMLDPPMRRFNNGLLVDPAEPENQNRPWLRRRQNREEGIETWNPDAAQILQAPRSRRRRRNRSFDGTNWDSETGNQNQPRTWIVLRPLDPSNPFSPIFTPENPRRPVVDPRNYFFGPGLNELIEDLTQNDRPGPLPAPESVISKIPTVKIDETHLKNDSRHCPVCMEEFNVGGEASELPCNHIFHPDCIVPWLRLHNSCPVCRHEIPVPCEEDDSESSNGGEGRNRRCTRWVRRLASLWPFRARYHPINPQADHNDSTSTPTSSSPPGL